MPDRTPPAWRREDGNDVVLLLRGASSRQKAVRVTRPVLRPDRDWNWRS